MKATWVDWVLAAITVISAWFIGILIILLIARKMRNASILIEKIWKEIGQHDHDEQNHPD